LPDVLNQLIGIVPVAANCRLYVVPTVPTGKATGVVIDGATVIGGAEATDRVNVRASLPAVFDAVIVKLNDPDCVGVPESNPVEFKFSPPGMVPDV
jgi:hypothetical protein